VDRKVRDALDLVQLPGYENRYPKQLSGGQQQRIALARAVVFSPPVLLMDEPLGALDKKLREHMQLEIKHIHSQLKVTVIYVTHDQEEALVMSDRIVIMNQGKIEQVGTSDEIYEKPINKFVAGFVGESNFVEGKIIIQRGNDFVIQLDDESRHEMRIDQKVSVGDNVCFSIRPEKLMIAEPEHQSKNAFEGVIREIIYVGDTLRYKIQFGREKTIYVREMCTQKARSHKEGDRVKVFWDPASLTKL